MGRLLVTKLRPVGRYALGVLFSDGHDSILPYRELRRHCRCDECVGVSSTDAPAANDARIEVADLQQIGEETLFVRWRDGHETLYVADEMRGICRCAHCVGEPNYPITKQ